MMMMSVKCKSSFPFPHSFSSPRPLPWPKKPLFVSRWRQFDWASRPSSVATRPSGHKKVFYALLKIVPPSFPLIWPVDLALIYTDDDDRPVTSVLQGCAGGRHRIITASRSQSSRRKDNLCGQPVWCRQSHSPFVGMCSASACIRAVVVLSILVISDLDGYLQRGRIACNA